MKLYIHKWLDKQTNQFVKTGEARMANSVKEAIEDYYEEEGTYKYVDTLVLDTETNRFITIDIEAEIEERKIQEMTVGEAADYLGLSITQADRYLDRYY